MLYVSGGGIVFLVLPRVSLSHYARSARPLRDADMQRPSVSAVYSCNFVVGSDSTPVVETGRKSWMCVETGRKS
eukprot:2869-Eustigmatos_ZCMA.PRE.1